MFKQDQYMALYFKGTGLKFMGYHPNLLAMLRDYSLFIFMVHIIYKYGSITSIAIFVLVIVVVSLVACASQSSNGILC